MKPNQMKPCPMLKKAASEIEDILKKYDIGGHIMLASKEHGEYLLHFPTWSKAQFEFKNETMTGIRFKAKGFDENGTLASTVHMFQVFQETSGNLFVGIENLMKELKKKMTIEGGPERV